MDIVPINISSPREPQDIDIEQDEEKQNKNTTKHNMFWTQLYANKHK